MISIGTSGFTYQHWRGVFYPENLPQKKWLEYYANFFHSIELNVTFYRLPSEDTFESWYRRTPQNFSFSLKGSRFITHIKKLTDHQKPVQSFFMRTKRLKEKHRVTLWQLPPNFKVHPERLERFLQSLKDYRSCLHVFEFRDQSWFSQEVFEILRNYDMSVCMADWPQVETNIPPDSPFLYVRRHGPKIGSLYAGSYSEKDLKKDSEMLLAWSKEGKEVFIYFNNDASGYAVQNALVLQELVEKGQVS